MGLFVLACLSLATAMLATARASDAILLDPRTGSDGSPVLLKSDQGAKKPPKWGTSKIADSRIRIQNDGFHGRKVMAGACHARRNSELRGEELVPGEKLVLNSTEECCEACRKFKPVTADGAPCNVWNFCDGSHPWCKLGECSLHYLPRPWDAAIVSGPDVATVSGIATPRPKRPASIVDPAADRRYHVVVSAQGRAVHWQSRIHYYHYRKVQRVCRKQPVCHMGGYTRLLHSGEADDLMYEIPTYVVDKLPPGMEDPEYLALNRPYAFMQWSKRAIIPEKYVFMMEPDHIWVRPMPNLMINDRPMGWPFWYIQSAMTEQLALARKYVGPLNRTEVENKVAPTGSSPMLMTMEDLNKTAPLWLSYGTLIHADPEALEVFGFMHEMNAFVFALYHAGIHDVDLDPIMMSQPPYGPPHILPFYILHYTYAWEYNAEGFESFYRFDKRYYYEHPPLRNFTAPPQGVQNEQIWFLYSAFKEAMAVIPNWDDYTQRGSVQGLWDGVLAPGSEQTASA